MAVFRRFTFVCALALLTGCGATVNTSLRPVLPVERTARILRLQTGDPQFAPRLSPAEKARACETWSRGDSLRQARASELTLALALRPPVVRTEAAPGFALMAVRLAWESLQGSGVPAARWTTDARTRSALAAYNKATGVFVKLTSASLVEGAPASLSTPDGTVPLRVTFPRFFPAGYYDRLVLAEQIRITGFRNRVATDGLGVALVGIRERIPGREAEMTLFPSCGVAAALSCVIEFFPSGKNACTIRLIDSKQTDRLRIRASTLPLSTDFTAPLAFSFSGANDLLLGLRNLLNVSIGEQDSGLYLSEPFDPNRIPVLLIHGLSSSPIVWRNLANEAMRDPVVRRNFQFVYAYYATGAPVMYSAAEIKRNMQLLRRTYGGQHGSRGSRDLAVVGYSMGGVIAQILVTDIGNRLWDKVSPVPFEQVHFDPQDVPDLRANVFWTPLPGIQQVIFIATPHQGTRMADASFARLADNLIRLPSDFLQFQTRVFGALSAALGGTSSLPSKVTGLDGLSTKSALFRALEGVPFAKGVKYYSIIGDRGKGDSPDSTDGVVGYWSSHLPGAESELIVPTGHDAQASPLSEAEILRILRENPDL